jgi:uncharacterized protein YndB with AHSA1/START domain
MAHATEAEGAIRPEPLRISRTFPAPREAVFKAWSSGERVKRWFCPADFTVPDAKIEMRPGGPFEVCMRAPDGTEHWTRGAFAEVTPFERLELDLHVTDAAGRILLYAYTEVDFVEVPDGTRMDVMQTYTLLAPETSAMVQGAPIGWSQTLDRLAVEVVTKGAGQTQRSIAHGVFHLERTYEAPVERVFHALSDEAAKSRWFNGPPGKFTLLERRLDFRIGGTERLKGLWDNGLVTTFDAVYHDIVPMERIVYSYAMLLDEVRISVSLATLELERLDAGRTRLKVAEQGAFLDGYDDSGSREHGTNQLLDALGVSLKD